MSYHNGYGGGGSRGMGASGAVGGDGQSVGSSVGSNRRGASGASPAVRPRPGGAGMFSSNSSLRSQNTIGSGTSYASATPNAGAPPPPPADESPIQDFAQVLDSTTAEDWRTRTMALAKLLESIPPREDEDTKPRNGGGYVPRPGTIAWYKAPPSLRRLVVPLSTLLMDPRSTVVKVTCQSLTTLIRRTTDDHAKYLMRDLVPTVMSLHAQTVNVIKTYALQFMLACVAHVRFRSGIPVLLDRMAQDKSRDVREACARYLREILMHWPYGPAPSHRRTRSEGGEDLLTSDNNLDNSDENDGHLVLTNYLSRDVAYLIGTGLCVAISDSSQSVRAEAKVGFEAFRKVYPEIWEDIVHRPDGPLAKDPRLKRTVISAALQVNSSGSPRLSRSVQRNKSAAVPKVSSVPSSPSINKSLSSEGLGLELEESADGISLGSNNSRHSVLSRVSAPAGPGRSGAGVPRSISGPVVGGAKMAGRPGGRLGGAQRVPTSSSSARSSPSKSSKQSHRLTGQSPGMPMSRKVPSRSTQPSATSTAVAAAVAAQAMRSPAAAAAAAAGRSSRNRSNNDSPAASRRMSVSAPGSPRVHVTPRASTPQPTKPSPAGSGGKSRSRPPTPVLVMQQTVSPVAEPVSPMEIDFVHSAATSIQAGLRGMSARKKASRQRQEVEKIAQSLAQLALSSPAPPQQSKTPVTKNTTSDKLVLSPELQMLALAKWSVLSEMKDAAKESPPHKEVSSSTTTTRTPTLSSNGESRVSSSSSSSEAVFRTPPRSRQERKTQSSTPHSKSPHLLEKKPSTLLLKERLSLAGATINGNHTPTSTPPPPPPPPPPTTAQEIDDFDFPPLAPSEEEEEEGLQEEEQKNKDEGASSSPSSQMVSPQVASIALEILQSHKKHMDEVMEVLRQEMDLIRHVEVLGEAMTEEDILRYFEQTLSFVDAREQSSSRLRTRLDRISRGAE